MSEETHEEHLHDNLDVVAILNAVQDPHQADQPEKSRSLHARDQTRIEKKLTYFHCAEIILT